MIENFKKDKQVNSPGQFFDLIVSHSVPLNGENEPKYLLAKFTGSHQVSCLNKCRKIEECEGQVK